MKLSTSLLAVPQYEPYHQICRETYPTSQLGSRSMIRVIPFGMDNSLRVQSRELCWPCKICIAKDTKELYHKYFTDFFAFFKQVEERGFDGFLFPHSLSALLKTHHPTGRPSEWVALASKKPSSVTLAAVLQMPCLLLFFRCCAPTTYHWLSLVVKYMLNGEGENIFTINKLVNRPLCLWPKNVWWLWP
jgi:hypothetical protein